MIRCIGQLIHRFKYEPFVSPEYLSDRVMWYWWDRMEPIEDEL
jgi:hypothetical protein